MLNKPSDKLIRNASGKQSATKEEEGDAIKQFLAVRGRGVLMSYEGLADRARNRSTTISHTSAGTEGVVGVLDLGRRAAAVTVCKTHGSSGVTADLFKALPASTAFVYDPNCG